MYPYQHLSKMCMPVIISPHYLKEQSHSETTLLLRLTCQLPLPSFIFNLVIQTSSLDRGFLTKLAMKVSFLTFHERFRFAGLPNIYRKHIFRFYALWGCCTLVWVSFTDSVCILSGAFLVQNWQQYHTSTSSTSIGEEHSYGNSTACIRNMVAESSPQ